MHTEKCPVCGRVCHDIATYIHHDCEPYSWLDDSEPIAGRDYDDTIGFEPTEDYYDEN